MARTLACAPPPSGALRATQPPAAGPYWARAARLARARLWPFLTFALLLQAFNVARSNSVIGLNSTTAAAPYLTADVMTVIPLMFGAIVLTEALALRPSLHLLVSLAALVVAELLGLAFLRDLYGAVNLQLVEARVIVSDDAYALRQLWVYTGSGMLLVVYFAFREHELAAAKAAQDANTQRATVERATLAARLKVMQARVEPELLFGALSDVRDLYLHDRDAAEALLDDLIAYLRAALPLMRSDSSTLGREAALAVAYAKVLPAARRGDLRAAHAVPEEAQDLPFPPMVLLPLVRAAVQSPVARICIESDPAPTSSVIVWIEPGRRPAGWDDAGLEAVRAALAHGFGPTARLDVEDDRAVVRWAQAAAR